jgi:hypothetical protein
MDFQLHVPVVSARAILMGSDRYQEVCCVPHIYHANENKMWMG